MTYSNNGKGKWDTRKVKEHCLWTKLARHSKHVEKEHVVPVAEIVRILLPLDTPELSDIYNVIDEYCVY